MNRDFSRELRPFGEVWRRVTESRPGPPPVLPPPPPPPGPPGFPPPPPWLKPKRGRRCCQRYR